MAIVKMKKIVLAAPQNVRDGILNLLQTKGYVQLIDLKEELTDTEGLDYFNETKSVSGTELDYNKIKFSYQFLKQYNTQKKSPFAKREIISKEQFDQIGTRIDWQEIYDKCKEIDESLTKNRNERTKMVLTAEQYNEWAGLDISDRELKDLKRVSYFTGTISNKYEAALYEELNEAYGDVYIEKVSVKKQDLNLFILCHSDDMSGVSDILKKYGFTKVSLDLKSTPLEQVKALNADIETLDSEYDELTKKAVELSERLRDIEKIYDYISNKLEKENSISKLVKTQKTFVLKGWIAEDNTKELEELVEKNFSDAFIDFEEPLQDEEPPIILKNNALNEPFEAITSMYALPQYTEVDPTPVLTPFYLIFFGMMAGDIGYGLVLFILAGLALKFMDLEGDSRKLVKLLFYVSIPTIIFGWVFGGFFGDAIPVTPLWVNPVDRPMDVLYVSIALGILHLFTGLGVKAYWFMKNGKVMDAVYDVFLWYLLLTGLIWLLLGGGTIPKYMSIIGAAGLLLTQGRANKSLIGKFFGGVYGLYGVTSYIGDVLSYSRLLALGLATGLIGSSFNLLIRLLGSGPVAIIFGSIIFVAGHTFNLLIGMLGTFVHTCRLEYLEFFGKFYEGGGKAFNPLKISTKFIKVNTER